MKCIDCVYFERASRECRRHTPMVNRINSRQSDFPTVRADDWCGDGFPKDARCENCRFSSLDFDKNLMCNFAAISTEQCETYYTSPDHCCGQYQFALKAAKCSAKVVEKADAPEVAEKWTEEIVTMSELVLDPPEKVMEVLITNEAVKAEVIAPPVEAELLTPGVNKTTRKK